MLMPEDRSLSSSPATCGSRSASRSTTTPWSGARQLRVAGDHAGRGGEPLADVDLLAQLAQRADAGLDLGEAVAVAGGGGLAGQDEVGLHHGDADPVQPVDA